MGSVHAFPAVDPLDLAIGSRIRMWRSKRGMDQDHLAQLLKVTTADIRLIETGRRHLGLAEIDAATRALRLPLWALVADQPRY